MSRLVYVNPDDMIHPLRHEMTDEELGEVLVGIAADENWMSLEEIMAAQDMLFDHIAAKLQTVPGEIILQ